MKAFFHWQNIKKKGDEFFLSSKSYKSYALEVMKELSKSDDEEILEKFIKELCKISTLKQFEKYKTPIFKQSEVVKNVFKWLDNKCKIQRDNLEKVKQQKKNGHFMYFDDNGKSYLEEEEVRLETLVGVKISIEKYMRKLRHQEKETGD